MAAPSNVSVPLGSPASYSATVDTGNPQPNAEWQVVGSPTYAWSATVGTPDPTTGGSTTVTATASTLSKSQVYSSVVTCTVTYQVQKVDPGQSDNGQMSYISGSGSATVQIYVISATIGAPPTRIPISGSIVNHYPISVSISPSSLPSSDAVTITVVNSTATGAATVTPATLTASGKITLAASENSSSLANMTLQVSFGDTLLATSSAFTISTDPTGVTTTTLSSSDHFGITTKADFISESGNESDITTCAVKELVSGGHRDTPPFPTGDSTNGSWMTMEPLSDQHDCTPSTITYPPTGYAVENHSYIWFDYFFGSNTNYKTIYSDVITRTVAAVTGSSTKYNFTTAITGGYSATCTETGP